MKLGKVGVIGRFKPLHIGAQVMLETICKLADEVIIGIGSSNKYNYRNPFTAEESKDMIDLVLEEYDNYNVILVPDFAHLGEEHKDGQSWVNYVTNVFGELDYFVTGNAYVKELLSPHYEIIHPSMLISEDQCIIMRASEVRYKMAQDNIWKKFVPVQVTLYLESNQLVSRFKKEFGLETLTKKHWQSESRDTEYQHTLEK